MDSSTARRDVPRLERRDVALEHLLHAPVGELQHVVAVIDDDAGLDGVEGDLEDARCWQACADRRTPSRASRGRAAEGRRVRSGEPGRLRRSASRKLAFESSIRPSAPTTAMGSSNASIAFIRSRSRKSPAAEPSLPARGGGPRRGMSVLSLAGPTRTGFSHATRNSAPSASSAPVHADTVALQRFGTVHHRRLAAAEDQAAPLLFVPVLAVAPAGIARADEIRRPAAAKPGIGSG